MAVCLTAQTGTPLAAWTPGTLDVHQISTGLGNAALFILPDGTTLLVDADAVAGSGEVEAHPDGSRGPGEWIARYIRRHLPAGVTGLDYALITHFHGDHMGQVTPSSPMDRTGTYRLSGITDVAEALPIQTLLDRGFPDYSYPTPLTDESTANYRRFVEARRARGMTVERFHPESRAQITLRHEPAKHPAFEIRNDAHRDRSARDASGGSDGPHRHPRRAGRRAVSGICSGQSGRARPRSSGVGAVPGSWRQSVS
jgi:hypothetical protein